MNQVEKFFKRNIEEVKPYLKEIIERYGASMLRLIWESEEAIRLMANENPFGPSPLVFETIRNTLTTINRYPEPTCQELKEKISEYTKLEPRNIVVGAGSLELIDRVSRAFISKGDKALISVPTYSPYEKRVKICGGEVVVVEKPAPNLYWDVEGIKEAVSNNVKILFISSPNNPVGNEIREEDLHELLETGKIIVLDEAYYEYSSRTFSHLVNEFENLVVLRTFSKAFGLAGLRIGYALTNEKVSDYLEKAKVDFNIGCLPMKAAVAALEDLEYMEKAVKETLRERGKVLAGLCEIEGLKPYPSKTNFILVKDKGEFLKASEIVDELLADGILVRNYSYKPGLKGEYFRVTIGRKEQNKAFMEKLKEITR